jgi:hypothetical protein
MPDDEPTVATLPLALVQVPPGTSLSSVEVAPAHNVAVPVMLVGVVFTVIVFVEIHEVPKE